MSSWMALPGYLHPPGMRIRPHNGCMDANNLIELQPERLNAQLATAVVPANPGPVMNFTGDPSVEDVSFSCSSLAMLPFLFKAAPFAKFPPRRVFFFPIVAAKPWFAYGVWYM